MARTFFIETHGCQMNEHDSEKIAGLLIHRGLVPVQSADEADLFLLNTCSVREKAAQKVYSRLGEFRSRKQRDPNFLIGVVGCVAQQEGEEMARRVPFVDLVVGTHLYHEIPDLLEPGLDSRSAAGRNTQVATRFLDDRSPVELDEVQRESSFRANITIMEGCNKRCAFCIVPFTRGLERNRPADNILEEVRRVIDKGYVEILLLGQTVNSYRDPARQGYRFAELLRDIAEMQGLKRLRFTSPHPRHFTDELIAVIASHPVICDQVHVPMQSGSSAILRRMRRQHDRDWYLELLSKFRNCSRYLALSTDVIVGFPGESEQDYEQTLDLVRQARYEQMFSFKYSPRPQTEAFPWDDDIPDVEKTRRLMILQRLQREIQLEIHAERYLGREFEVLVEGTARDGFRRFGRTTTNKVVNFAGNEQPGEFSWIKITENGPNSLVGEPVFDCSLGQVLQEASHG
jgi:tRNA-2-methylthio-N6-dimethylallyladenosine synthase